MDQRGDDGCSLSFDSEPLEETTEILGAPEVTLEVAADRTVALIAVRLNDLAPGGASSRVTYGVLNLTHRDGHEQPAPMEPGKRYRVKIVLNHAAHAFPAGHRLRLAISTSYWPIVWPSPEPVSLSLFTGDSFLDLPVRPPDSRDAALRIFEPPERAALETTELRPATLRRTVERDLIDDRTSRIAFSGLGDLDTAELTSIKDIGLEVGHMMRRDFRIGDDDPNQARSEIMQKTWFRREKNPTRVETRTRCSSTPDDFVLEAELTAYENDRVFFTRSWNRRVKRDLL